MLPVWASIDIFNTWKQSNTRDFYNWILFLPFVDWLCRLSTEGKSDSTGGAHHCPYGGFRRDSRRVTGPSSTSPVYHTINGPRQQKKIVIQNNTNIDKNM